MLISTTYVRTYLPLEVPYIHTPYFPMSSMDACQLARTNRSDPRGLWFHWVDLSNVPYLPTLPPYYLPSLLRTSVLPGWIHTTDQPTNQPREKKIFFIYVCVCVCTYGTVPFQPNRTEPNQMQQNKTNHKKSKLSSQHSIPYIVHTYNDDDDDDDTV
ncbi:hypothetical protein GGS21DRAFT_529157, partial [Xylaria nigripes]